VTGATVGAEFQSELPEGVNVETVTLMGYSDGRPTEVIMAGTADDEVKHLALNARGEQMASEFLTQLYLFGIAGPAS
jgi:hypothetical protein